MKVLLVQPWIADFAAYNFWIRPLGLYRLAEWLDARGVTPALVDALSPFPAPGRLPRQVVETPSALVGFGRRFARYGIAPEEMSRRLLRHSDAQAVLVTSGMSYWYPGVQWTITVLRELLGDRPVVLGGTYATLWPSHAARHSGADLVLPGPLEQVGNALADFLGMPREPIRPPRPWYELGLWDGVAYGAVATGRGCTFRCSYCASRLLHGPYSPRPIPDVIRELEALSHLGVTEVAFYDDALLVDFPTRLRPILEALERKGLGFRFHTPNGLHARLITPEIARWMAQSGFATIRMSLETVDRGRQRKTGGKVSNSHCVEAVANLLSAGLHADNIGIYLLMGLPGQTPEEVARGIEFVASLGVAPYLAEFSPIPGTADWERLLGEGKVSWDMDPLLTNNTVFFRHNWGYSEEEIEGLIQMARDVRAKLRRGLEER